MAIKYLRRITAFLMVFMMVFTLMPSAAFAEETNDSAGVETVVTADDTEETVNTKEEETTKEETKENVESNDSEVKDTSNDNDDVDKDTTTYEDTTTSNNSAENDDKDSAYEETTTSNDPAYDDKDAGSDDEDNTTEEKKEEKATSDETWDTGNQTSGSTEATDGDTDDTDIFDTGDEPEEEVKFDEQMTVDGVTVRVTADKGVFPQGSSLEVTKVPVSEEKKALEAVKEEGVDGKIAQSYTFDITIYDKDGNEIQPNTDKGKVKVSFTTDEVGRYDTSVYHMDGDEAEKLETKEKGETASAKTDGFSWYIVVFTYYHPDEETTKEYWVELTGGVVFDLKDTLRVNAHITLTSITSAYCGNTSVDVYQDNEMA